MLCPRLIRPFITDRHCIEGATGLGLDYSHWCRIVCVGRGTASQRTIVGYKCFVYLPEVCETNTRAVVSVRWSFSNLKEIAATGRETFGFSWSRAFHPTGTSTYTLCFNQDGFGPPQATGCCFLGRGLAQSSAFPHRRRGILTTCPNEERTNPQVASVGRYSIRPARGNPGVHAGEEVMRPRRRTPPQPPHSTSRSDADMWQVRTRRHERRLLRLVALQVRRGDDGDQR